MDHVLGGFTDELLKLAGKRMSQAEREEQQLRALYRDVKARSQKGGSDSSLRKLRGKGRKVSRDYLASTLIGAAATPAALLASGKLSRVLNNREVIKAMKGVRGARRKALSAHLESGPMLGRTKVPDLLKGKKKPMMTHAELAGHAARGGAMGSIIQMIRDRFSGSAGVGDRR